MKKYTRRDHVMVMAAFSLVAGGAAAACDGDDDYVPGEGEGDTDAATTSSSSGGGGSSGRADAAVGAPDAKPDAPVNADEYTVDVGLGYATGCALSNKGRVKCWGDAVDGTFGFAPVPGRTCWEHEDQAYIDCDSRPPTDVAVPYPVEQLSVGYETVCVIANNAGTRQLGCWGREDSGRLTTSADSPGAVIPSITWIALPSPPKKLASGQYFKLALLEDGSLVGWGENVYGHYGAPELEIIPTPTKVWPFSDADGGIVQTSPILDIAAGRINSLALTADGLYGTGDNSYYQGQLEEPEELHGWTKLPTLRNDGDAGVPTSDPIAKLYTTNGRGDGSCYITAAGKAFCWSNNAYAQNGTARTEGVEDVLTPELIDMPAGRTVKHIAIATGGICAIADDDTVYCWGDNAQGAAGQTPPEGLIVVPSKVPNLQDVSALAVGTNFVACAVTRASHQTYCWGANGYGQLGTVPPADSGPQQSTTPVEVPLVW